MSLALRCPSCQKRMSVPEHAIGRRVQCPRCENVFRFTGQRGITLGRVRPRGVLATPIAAPIASTVASPVALPALAVPIATALPLTTALPVASPVALAPIQSPAALDPGPRDPDSMPLTEHEVIIDDVQTMPVIDLPEVPAELLDQLKIAMPAEPEPAPAVEEPLDLEVFHAAPVEANLPEVTEAEMAALFLDDAEQEPLSPELAELEPVELEPAELAEIDDGTELDAAAVPTPKLPVGELPQIDVPESKLLIDLEREADDDDLVVEAVEEIDLNVAAEPIAKEMTLAEIAEIDELITEPSPMEAPEIGVEEAEAIVVEEEGSLGELEANLKAATSPDFLVDPGYFGGPPALPSAVDEVDDVIDAIEAVEEVEPAPVARLAVPPLAAVPVAGIPVAGVPLAAVPMAAVPLAARPIAAAPIAAPLAAPVAGVIQASPVVGDGANIARAHPIMASPIASPIASPLPTPKNDAPIPPPTPTAAGLGDEDLDALFQQMLDDAEPGHVPPPGGPVPIPATAQVEELVGGVEDLAEADVVDADIEEISEAVEADVVESLDVVDEMPAEEAPIAEADDVDISALFAEEIAPVAEAVDGEAVDIVEDAGFLFEDDEPAK